MFLRAPERYQEVKLTFWDSSLFMCHIVHALKVLQLVKMW